jgi:hypothetical protein
MGADAGHPLRLFVGNITIFLSQKGKLACKLELPTEEEWKRFFSFVGKIINIFLWKFS